MARERKSDAPPPPPPQEITPEDAVRLADAIRKIDKAMKLFTDAGLNRRAIVTLLFDVTGVGKRDINAVLDGLEVLGDTYLEKQKK